jgi:Uncharacterised nucleotidyltransferase
MASPANAEHPYEANIAVLLWAVGANVPEYALTGHDEDVGAQAVLRHRLTARLLARAVEDGATWAAPSFIASLTRQQEQIEEGLHARLTELERLSQLVGDLRPALLKGPTAYFITGDERCIRFSNDIDLLTDRPDELTARLLNAGYRQSDDYCRPHEYSSLYRNNINIDVHRYFPVIESPQGRHDCLALKSSNDISADLKAANERQLTYDMFLRDSFSIRSAPGILRAGPTVGSLIACTHMFREYHDTHALLPYATIRLGELCEYLQMRQHAHFNPGLFDDLASSTGSAYSLEFIAYLESLVFGASRHAPVNSQYTHDAWLPGFVVLDDRASKLADLLIRSPEYPVNQFIADLNPAIIGLDPHGASPRFGFGSTTDRVQMTERALVHGSPGAFTYEISREAELLRIVISAESRRHRQYVFLVSTGDYLYEITVYVDSGEPITTRRRNASRPKSASGSAKWKADVPSHVYRSSVELRIEIMLPWNLIGACEDQHSLPILFGIRSIDQTVESSSAVLIPAIIEMQ